MTDPQASSDDLIRQTIAFYDQNADDFCKRTQSIDLGPIYEPFIKRLPDGAHILDAGCGSGRDSLAFKRMGYRITAMDASAELVAHVSALLDQPAIHLTFQEMRFEEEFDAVWANASLLHVPQSQIADVIERFVKALKPGGVFYLSFQYGTSHEFRAGRLFGDYDETTFSELIARFPALEIVEMWTTEDVRPQNTTQWLNAITRKAAGRAAG